MELRTRARMRRTAVVAVVVALLLVPAAVWAAHTFPDVPDTHPFHDDIAWLHGAGITQGYADGTYRPGESVSRGEMAAFLHRMSGHDPGTDPSVSADTLRGVELFATAWVTPDGALADSAGAASAASRLTEGVYLVGFDEFFFTLVDVNEELAPSHAIFPHVTPFLAPEDFERVHASCGWTFEAPHTVDQLVVECVDVADGEPVDVGFTFSMWRTELIEVD